MTRKRINSREAIEQTARDLGWRRIVGDLDAEIWARGDDRIVVNYKLFGSTGSMRLCRYYGKEPSAGINWGVATALHNDREITGKNKKGQVMEAMKA